MQSTMLNMTYRDLLKKLQNLPSERLDDDVTVHMTETDEFIGYVTTNIQKGDDVLDDGHFYLEIDC